MRKRAGTDVGIGTAKLNRVSTVEALADALRELVLNAQITPGTPLREAQLADQFRVGRHSVRAALQLLTREGLLIHEPNRGASVPVYDEEDIEDIFRLRSALELEGASMLARQRLAPQEAALAAERMAHLPRKAPWSQIVKSELEFHLALMEATRSERLVRVYRALQSEIGLCIVLQKHTYDSPSAVAAEHQQLLTVLETRGIGEVREAFRRHIGDTLAWLRPPQSADPAAIVEKQPGPKEGKRSRR